MSHFCIFVVISFVNDKTEFYGGPRKYIKGDSSEFPTPDSKIKPDSLEHNNSWGRHR